MSSMPAADIPAGLQMLTPSSVRGAFLDLRVTSRPAPAKRGGAGDGRNQRGEAGLMGDDRRSRGRHGAGSGVGPRG